MLIALWLPAASATCASQDHKLALARAADVAKGESGNIIQRALNEAAEGSILASAGVSAAGAVRKRFFSQYSGGSVHSVTSLIAP